MDKTFDEFFKRALDHEGRVCEDVPGDRGGPTKWGITIGRLAAIKGVREPKRGTAAFEALKAELFALSEDEIAEIYRRDYWAAVRGDDLPAGLDYCVADYGLNSGPSRAVKALQKLCGNPQTGTMDEETLREAAAYAPADIIMLFQDERARFLNAIVDSNPSQRKFIKGWLARVGDVRRAALNMADKKVAPTAPAPMPKAEPPPVPSSTETARKSLTARLGIAGVLAWLEEQFGFLKSLLPDVTGQVQEIADPLTSLGGILKTNMSGILTAITVGILVTMIVRHVRDKRELTSLKGE